MKKRYLSLMMAALMIFSLLPFSAAAGYSGVCGDNLTWTLDDNGLLTISGTGDMYAYSPEDSPFNNRTNIREVIVEEGVTSLGSYAFTSCRDLTSAEIADTVTKIGDCAFEFCSALKKIVIPESVTAIGDMVFYRCESLTEAVIPEAMTVLDPDAEPYSVTPFSMCDHLRRVEFIGDEPMVWTLDEDGVLTINAARVRSSNFRVFEMNEISRIVIQDGATSIDQAAFYGCVNAESVQIPASVVEIGTQAFSSCNALKDLYYGGDYGMWSALTFHIGPSNQNLRDAEIHYYNIISNGELIGYLDAETETITMIDVEDDYDSDVLAIPSEFNGYPVTKIGEIFENCGPVQSVTIPDTVTSIPAGALRDCALLQDIFVDENNPVYGSENGILFNKDQSVLLCYPASKPNPTYAIPAGVVRIEEYAFARTSGVRELMVPPTVEAIAGSAFIWSEIESIQIADTVEMRGSQIFYSCKKLKSVSLPATMSHITDNEFYNCQSMESIQLPDGIEYIGTGAFDACGALKTVRLPGSLTTVKVNAFKGCNQLTDVYYDGSKSDWEALSILSGNTRLQNAAIHFLQPTPLAIVTQPQDVSGAVGETVSVNVEADGDGLTYQWQYRQPGKTTWNDSGMTGSQTDTLQIPVMAKRNGQSYRCVITDAAGNSVTSQSVTLSVAAPLAITRQPQDVSGFVGETVTVSVAAEGDGLTYQWQYRQPGKTFWNDSGMTGSTTATLQIPVMTKRDGQSYRCVITDAAGDIVISESASLTVAAPQTPLAITRQPQDVSGAVGETVTVSVSAEGDGLTYQWQYRQPGKTFWNDSGMTGSTTDTLHITVMAKRDGQSYRCIVKDAAGNAVTSEIATLTVAAPVTPLEITAQPQDVSGSVSETVIVSVTAQGDGLTYQWQYCQPGKSTWYNSGMNGNHTDTLEIPVMAKRDGQSYRCVVTDRAGNSVTSEPATLSVLSNPVK